AGRAVCARSAGQCGARGAARRGAGGRAKALPGGARRLRSEEVAGESGLSRKSGGGRPPDPRRGRFNGRLREDRSSSAGEQSCYNRRRKTMNRITVVAAVLALSAVVYPFEKKKKEEITQTLELPKDPPATATAETARLVFHVSPLSGKGLLSAQVRDALKALL